MRSFTDFLFTTVPYYLKDPNATTRQLTEYTILKIVEPEPFGIFGFFKVGLKAHTIIACGQNH